MVKLIALDMDQTLFGNDLVISHRVRRSIASAQARGVLVTLATGREFGLSRRFANDLSIPTPVICAQGGCVFEPVDGRVLRDVRLSPEVLPRILQAARQHQWSFHFEMSEGLFFPPESNHPPALFELLRFSTWTRVGNLLTDMPAPPHKVIVTLARTEDRARVVSEMEAELGESLTIVASHPHLVEGLPLGVNKGSGLAWLAEQLGISREQVMAIGDSEADLPMLKWAGFSVAMGNASPEVKAACQWTAPPLAEDGAAAAIERFTAPEIPR